MATCSRCNRTNIRKRKDGRKKCPRCGFLPGAKNLTRDGIEVTNNFNGEQYDEEQE